jgi:hypothetical protein
MRAGQRVGALLRPFIKEVTLFHPVPSQPS